MKFGLTQDQYNILQQLLVTPLQKKNASVYIFGSRARGTQQPFSDIDILYIEAPGSPIADSEISTLKEALENSNLPMKVDIVNNQNLASSFRSSVEKDRILLR
jgi:predicted nucleotidyltransferase